MKLPNRIKILAVLGFFLCSSTTNAEASSASREILRASQHHSNNFNYRKTIVSLRRALKVDPSDQDVRRDLLRSYISLGDSLSKENDLEESLHFFRLALYLKPSSTAAKEKLFQRIEHQGKQDPFDYMVHRTMADAEVTKGRFLDAIVENRIAVALHDDESTRLALNSAIRKRAEDPEYMPQFDMKPSMLITYDSESSYNLINQLIENNFPNEAMDKLDSYSDHNPEDKRVESLKERITELRKDLAKQSATTGDTMLKDGKREFARAYYLRSLENYFDPVVHTKAESLKDAASLHFDSNSYMPKLQRKLKESWQPNPTRKSKIPIPGSTTVLFHVDKDGKILDKVIYEREGSPRESAAMEALNKATLPAPPQETTFPIAVLFTFDYNVFGP